MIRQKSALKWLLWFLVCSLTAGPHSTAAVAPRNNEDVELHVKAAYLLNFVRYISWPASSPGPASLPLILGVLGQDSMVEVLERVISGKTVNSRPLKVKVFDSVGQIDHCDILFVPRSEAKHMQTILAGVSGRPILTVSDKDRFANSGGMIEFLSVDDTVRFTINNEAVGQAGLKLSSELLRVAYSVNGRHK